MIDSASLITSKFSWSFEARYNWVLLYLSCLYCKNGFLIIIHRYFQSAGDEGEDGGSWQQQHARNSGHRGSGGRGGYRRDRDSRGGNAPRGKYYFHFVL